MPDVERAALLWLALALLWTARASDDPAPPCVAPAEAASRGGHTTAVRCGEPGGPPLRGPAGRLFGRPVDLNCSDSATLETLSGIGPARAAAIVAERERAPFRDVADLARVHGIGPRTLERLRGALSVGPADRASVPSPNCRSDPGSGGDSREMP